MTNDIEIITIEEEEPSLTLSDKQDTKNEFVMNLLTGAVIGVVTAGTINFLLHDWKAMNVDPLPILWNIVEGATSGSLIAALCSVVKNSILNYHKNAIKVGEYEKLLSCTSTAAKETLMDSWNPEKHDDIPSNYTSINTSINAENLDCSFS